MPSTLSVKSLLVMGFHTHTKFPTKFKKKKKCSWGSETHANKNLFFGGGGGGLGCLGRPTPPPGGRAGSENDTLLPMTMICDRLKFWSGPAWRSKVIIRKPWRRKNKKKKKRKKKKRKKKKKKSDKTIRHSRLAAGNA